MGTLGYRKPACKRGHVNPPRYKSGACIPCRKEDAQANYQRDRDYRIRYAIERAKADPDARRDQQRAHRLGVTVGEVRAAIARCGGRCEACGRELPNSEMCLDHDHVKNRIRGVLCRFCNALEGMLNKQADRVEKLLGYLQLAADRLASEDREAEAEADEVDKVLIIPIADSLTKPYRQSA